MRNTQIRNKAGLLLALYIFQFLTPALAEQTMAAFYPGYTPPIESKAYQQFSRRPLSELSKLIYLVDRFAGCNIEIVYENIHYPAPLVAHAARMFLATHYKNEQAESWVLNWASTSYPSHEPILVKFPDGTYKLAREVLLEELKQLDSALKASPNN